jgi:hypothetical protein
MVVHQQRLRGWRDDPAPSQLRRRGPLTAAVLDHAAAREPLARAILDDPDAPGGRFVHWLAWGIGPDAGGLAEGEAAPLEGRNDFGTVGYRGPCPPRGRGPHRYRFRLHALGEELRLAPGAGVGELERALTANLLAVAELVATYER